jgi:hypothetical protein
MRTLLLSLLIGLTGLGFGYLKYQKAFEGVTESFQDPKERLAAKMRAVGTAIPEGDISQRIGKAEIVNGKVHDFGTMTFGSSRSHRFVIRNAGTGPLSLEVLSSTCKCTIGELEKSVLAPGEETGVELTWTAESMLRDFSQTATIRTSDPDQEEIQLSVRGFIGSSLVVDPIRILIGDVSSKDQTLRKTTLYSYYDKPLEVEEMTWADPNTRDRVQLKAAVRQLTAGEVEQHKDAKYAADIEVQLNQGMPAGPLNGFVELKTNLGEREKLQFGVSGKILSDIRVIGSTNFDERTNALTIGKIVASEGKVTPLLIGIRKDENGPEPSLTVDAIRPQETLQVKIGEPKARGSQRIFPVELIVPPGTAPVSFAGTNPTNFGKVVFRTNLEHSPELSMFVKFEVE